MRIIFVDHSFFNFPPLLRQGSQRLAHTVFLNQFNLLLSFMAVSILLACGLAPVQASQNLMELEQLVQSGAKNLALDFLQRYQPSYELDSEEWMQWERQRIAIYREEQEWDRLIDHLNQWPSAMPTELTQWSLMQQAGAWISKGDGTKALEILRVLIWSQFDDNQDQKLLAHWRRLVIRAFLADDQVDDARVAMQRYQQDYKPTDVAWLGLRARVLIRNKRVADVERLLKDEQSPELRSLFLLAHLRNGYESPASVYRTTVAKIEKLQGDVRILQQFWYVAALAAQQSDLYEQRIVAVTRVLENQRLMNQQSDDGVFDMSGVDLWQAYREYGQNIGNEMRLLIGEDESWYTAASNLVDEKPLAARALFAVLMEQSSQPRSRQLAHRHFSESLSQQEHGLGLIHSLYLSEKTEYGRQDLPPSVLHQLVDEALARSDFNLASDLMGDQLQPPKGVDPFFWQLRRARVLVFGNRVDQAVAVLQELLANAPVLSKQQADRYKQVLFDLQSVGKHRQAIELFERLVVIEFDLQLRRELLFWIADSYKGLEQHAEAARYYLKSAVLLDVQAMDPWAQTARYQAAQSLTSLGMITDARSIYEQLLTITKEPGRRAVLRNKLQQLHLPKKPQE